MLDSQLHGEPRAVLTPKGYRWYQTGHPWIYRGDLAPPLDEFHSRLVRVEDGRERFLGRAFYSLTSRISLRFVTFEDVPVDREFWRARLRAAIAYRKKVVEHSTAMRLVAGEADGCPGLIVDRYGDFLVVQSLSAGMERLFDDILSLLVEELSPRGIVVRNDLQVRVLEGLPRGTRLAHGEDPGELELEEHGIRYLADPMRGQKTGAFLDQRENRAAAGRYARGRCLDAFSYHGSFALHMAPRADDVTVVEISSDAIGRAERNAILNGFSNISFVEANAFDFLRSMDVSGERFDTVVLDPPAFARSRQDLEGALRGYKEINLRALKILAPGGTLITSSCSYHVSEAQLLALVSEAAGDVRRSVRIVEKRMQSRDHPVLLTMPETHYLKSLILQAD
jgi:23S rRNA (cytosine1962-C5)-methyltransferase